MMILNFKHIEDMINKNKYHLAVVYQGHINDVEIGDYPRFEIVKAENHESVINRLREIKNMYGGNYTILFGTGLKNQNIRNMGRVKVTFTNSEVGATKQEESPQINRAEIINEVREQIAAEFREKELLKEREAEKAELAELKTAGGKAAFAANTLIQMWMNPGKVAGTMNGADAPEKTDISKDELNKALGIILKTLGKTTIINLAKKFESGKAAGMIPMVKNFANS